MTISEFYNIVNGDYNDILSRFSSDILIDRFIKKFAQEESFKKFVVAMDSKNWADAFMHCHTLKGLCLNMSFSDLCSSVSELTEQLRPKTGVYDKVLYEEVKEKYAFLIDKINEYISQ